MTKFTVCLDFDGVLAHYTEWNGTIGALVPEGKRLAEMLRDAEYKIVIQSCRNHPQFKAVEENKQEMEKWLIEQDIPFDEIETEGKAFADVYVDDRGVNFPSNMGPAITVFDEIQKFDLSKQTIRKDGGQME